MAAIGATLKNAAATALVGAAAKFILQIKAPANQRLKILGFGCYFDGSSTTAVPGLIDLLRTTTDGTATAATPQPHDQGVAETLQAVGAEIFTVDPTAGAILKGVLCHPQGGYEYDYPQGQEPIVTGGQRVALRLNFPAAVNCRTLIKYEE